MGKKDEKRIDVSADIGHKPNEKKTDSTQPTVLDLFCGCGGLSKGFELAGAKIVGGIDFNAPAIKTFAHNFPDACAICKNLLEIDSEKIIESYKFGEVDILIGGPPCQGFSNANRYGTDETQDPRNRLFFEFIKFVDIFSPKAVLIENVRGILTMNKGYAAKRIVSIFTNRGYKVANKILDASDYGVPQRRLRNFFVMLHDEKFDFESLKKTDECPTVKEAIGELYSYEDSKESIKRLRTKPVTRFQHYLRSKDSEIHNHDVRYPAQKVQDRIAFVPQGGNWQCVPSEMWPTERNNRHSSAYKRLVEDDQSVTIDTGNNHSNYFHPIYNRIPTVREAARLQSFPDDFIFIGNRSEQYRQVGNAVPPLLSKAIAERILERLG